VLRKIHSRLPFSAFWGKDDVKLFSIVFILVYSVLSLAQDLEYWSHAPVGKTKIFTISFIDKQNGLATSEAGELLATKDGGKNWTEGTGEVYTDGKFNPGFIWKADIYCSVMKTTDGGNTWIAYEDGKQEHFCCVYLKDQNTGYKVASEFLSKVTSKVNSYLNDNKIDSLTDHPHQCTEYYKNADEGWALGWCVRNFNK
jgi:hypothetical protein